MNDARLNPGQSVSTMLIFGFLLYSPAGLAGARVGLSTTVVEAEPVAVGPEAALRVDMAGVGLHADFFSNYSRGSHTDLMGVIDEMVADSDAADCTDGLPSFRSGASTLAVRALVPSPGLLSNLRVGASTSVNSGISNGFMKQLLTDCSIGTEGPAWTVSMGPTVGLYMDSGPLELSVDVVYRRPVMGSYPYTWSEAPEDEQWRRDGVDYVHPELSVPVRGTLTLGSVYVRGGAIAGVSFATPNSTLLHEQHPDAYEAPQNTPFWKVEAAVGFAF